MRKTPNGKEYDLHGIDDRSDGFILDFQTGNIAHSVRFPQRPKDAEQMTYARACIAFYLDNGKLPTQPHPAVADETK